jgi:hypothetical protein
MKIMVVPKMKEDIVKVYSSTKLSIAFLNSSIWIFQISNDILMKNMSKKRKSFLLGCIITTLLITGLQEMVKALPTDWKIVDMSMTQLLNSGWQIAGHSSNRAAVGNAGSANNYDNTDFTYLLTKNGRYITCILENPRSPVAKVAACRGLN